MSDDLLPFNSSLLEQAITQSAARIEQTPINNGWLWDPDKCPSAFLPWLAHGLSVDSWNNHWSEQTKRQVVKDSVPMHRIKGSVKSIVSAIEVLGVDAQLHEDRQTDALLHNAKIVAPNKCNRDEHNQPSLTPALQVQLWRAIETTKPLRTQMRFEITNDQKNTLELAATSSHAQVQRGQWLQNPSFHFTPTQMTAVASVGAVSVQRSQIACSPDAALASDLNMQSAQSVIFINHTTMVCQ
ncbi:phage tail protein I [Pseudoalteromonas sp. S16_S37]|uniref:phage tail protein I n=1 Tax=Pseudoalteromonas sp. S16_S37 TaxID=2720228 RepID=UPI0016808D76|nr:phage tail protein I [Pseudoalteromonas sp. S16_S37]MBD1582497.1 phage tail protein I [Pseudoalteromonas sp. S16_S37]